MDFYFHSNISLASEPIIIHRPKPLKILICKRLINLVKNRR